MAGHEGAVLGTQVACSVAGQGAAKDSGLGGMGALTGKSASSSAASGIRAVAAKGPDGAGAVVIARYAEDNNATATILVALDIPAADLSRVRCHLTDSVRTYTEVPLDFDAVGTPVIRMMPNSFAIVEW